MGPERDFSHTVGDARKRLTDDDESEDDVTSPDQESGSDV